MLCMFYPYKYYSFEWIIMNAMKCLVLSLKTCNYLATLNLTPKQSIRLKTKKMEFYLFMCIAQLYKHFPFLNN